MPLANSSHTWPYTPGMLHWSGPTCCPLLTLFTHIRLYRVRYGMLTASEPLYLTSSKACLAWSETRLLDDKGSFLKDGMPACEASFNFFYFPFFFFPKLSLDSTVEEMALLTGLAYIRSHPFSCWTSSCYKSYFQSCMPQGVCRIRNKVEEVLPQ